MVIKIFSLILIQLIGTVVFAQSRCVDLFRRNEIVQVDRSVDLPRTLEKRLMSVIVEEEIRTFVANEMDHLTSLERDELRDKAQKFDKQLKRIQDRIDFYKKMTRSKRYRIVDESETAAHGEMNLLILGSFDQVYESLQKDFSSFEVNYLYIQALRSEILQMNAESYIDPEILKLKLDKLKMAEIDLGENFYTYIEVRKSIQELIRSESAESQKLGRTILLKLRTYSRSNTAKQVIDYRAISIEEIEKFRDLNPNALRASYKKAAVREFLTMLKMMTFSGPILAAVKFLIFKLPENISLFGLTDIPLRRIIGDTFGISEKQHWRDLYIGSMNAIIRQNGYPAKQWQLLKDENSLSPKKDELLVIFARVPENQKIWLEIKKYAKSAARNDAFSKDFYDRILLAEKAALLAGELPLHQAEAGATILGRISLTTIVGYYGLQKYFSDNPKEFGSAVHYAEKFISFFTN